jgi:type IV pilus assembly protein PilV
MSVKIIPAKSASPVKHLQARGFSMIEILITLVILSIGLLGIAGLQVTGMQSNRSAYFRSQATIIAYDMIDRMRTNVDGVAANHYDDLDSSNPPATAPTCIDSASGCSATSLAENDLQEWVDDHLALLPAGSGTVTRSGNIFTVTVNWVENTDPGDPDKSVAISVQL